MRKQGWKRKSSIAVLLVVLLLALINHEQLIKAFGLLPRADFTWLLLAFVTVQCGFLISSIVFHVVLRPIGYRVKITQMWAISVVSIILSQSVPAGGVASYAFMLDALKRRGISTGHATLATTLDALSYVCAALLLFLFGIIYMAFHHITTEGGSYVAAVVAVFTVTGVIFVLTRPRQKLTRWGLGIKDRLARLFRQEWSDAWVLHLVSEIDQGRRIIAENPGIAIFLILIQVVASTVHSLAMWMVLYSFGIQASFLTVLTGFGIVLITSSFNILPGGGGTVETALVAVLIRFKIESVAGTAAGIIFRLFEYWFMTPVAAVCYHWLTHSTPTHHPKPPAPDENENPV